MPLEETLATYKHLVAEASNLGIAYISFFRHYAMMDPTGRGTEHDVISAYGPLVSAPTLVVGNAGFQPNEAAQAISEGKIAAVAFGFMFVANPDLPKRIKTGKEISFQVDFGTLYTVNDKGNDASIMKGYLDYPEAVY
jgi:2,4-dienoyl-CoA reductase-like NADH-dependent reductase (Old Yellow Enzyme family)